MSTMQKNQTVWSIPDETLDSKYEKCRNITEEIYKRINITFQIKKLEGTQSELSEYSDQIDSNELSNETDLFACDKSDTISSSTEAEKPTTCDKYINNNNNEETRIKKANITVYKRPKKRFRKRVKKRQNKTKSDSDGSSDEAPLSRIIECPGKIVKSEVCPKSESPDNVMGVPNIIIITKDLKPKIKSPERKEKTVKEIKTPKTQDTIVSEFTIMKSIDNDSKSMAKEKNMDWKDCSVCNLSFRGERGLRRHMTMSHFTNADEAKKSDQRDVKPV